MYAKGKNAAVGCVAVYAAKSNRHFSRAGLTVGKGVGNAVSRSRAKRILRVAFDNVSPGLCGSYDLIIVARNRIVGKKSQEVTRDLYMALDKLGLCRQ